MRQTLPNRTDELLRYDIAPGVSAFSTLRDASLPFSVVQARQVHSDRIGVITDAGTTREELEGIDALVTNIPGVAIGARTADCVPVLLYDPAGKAIAAIHSGWRGTVRRISAKAIKVMSENFGTRPGNILAVIGPSIGPESFQTGAEVAEQFRLAGLPVRELVRNCGEKIPGTMMGGLHLDLWKANRMILEDAGVNTSNIFISGIDTYQFKGFFSARREGTECGRIINAIRLNPTVAGPGLELPATAVG